MKKAVHSTSKNMNKYNPVKSGLQLAIVGIAASLWAPFAIAASDTPAMKDDHAGHTSAPVPAANVSTAAPAPAPAMDHGDMKMQGGSAPADARDPNAYSGGFTLGTGPYVLPGGRSLHLADEKINAYLLANKFESVWADGQNLGTYDLIARIGRDYNGLVIKAEGEFGGGKIKDARTEALWSHAYAPFWDAQLGLREDSGGGPNRTWLAFGVQGLAPYWFELDVTGYVGKGGNTALRVNAEYELLITQKLVLQPSLEVNLYGQNDPAREVGRGLSDLNAGLRLRYEFTRQFAPYIGVQWTGRFGNTADMARSAGEPTSETSVVAGVRFWF